ncbi:hypothetical protein MAPG_02204 [Magnaporthiopsis poae ATCC 64411]|uniref:Uncharacterized protein n=1 Tax=Magnaporthiopsis poae (strain ATCC 64411 / 73-15) TaxID=644358 RepID=A0A0C4DQQ8_MAGP6|nr:hypothetical protein MAPG_02204 [Magnaporthiopsis poae ATCC 64411]
MPPTPAGLGQVREHHAHHQQAAFMVGPGNSEVMVSIVHPGSICTERPNWVDFDKFWDDSGSASAHTDKLQPWGALTERPPPTFYDCRLALAANLFFVGPPSVCRSWGGNAPDWDMFNEEPTLHNWAATTGANMANTETTAWKKHEEDARKVFISESSRSAKERYYRGRSLSRPRNGVIPWRLDLDDASLRCDAGISLPGVAQDTKEETSRSPIQSPQIQPG